MTTQEHQELNCWIAENVMGWKRDGDWYEDVQKGCDVMMVHDFMPTYDPAAAMAVLKKCCEAKWNVECWKSGANKWFVSIPLREHYAEAETLELAICLFAKKLFTK